MEGFFGNKARIIGDELNPEVIKWREFGFEIFIGDQSDPSFWIEFFDEVGDINVLLDDGGHRNVQQIVTVKSSLPHLLDGGIIIVEDTQTSFMKFESFKKFSFVRYLQGKIHSLYARSDELKIESDMFSKLVFHWNFLLVFVCYKLIGTYVRTIIELKIKESKVIKVTLDTTLMAEFIIFCEELITGYRGTIYRKRKL